MRIRAPWQSSADGLSRHFIECSYPAHDGHILIVMHIRRTLVFISPIVRNHACDGFYASAYFGVVAERRRYWRKTPDGAANKPDGWPMRIVV